MRRKNLPLCLLLATLTLFVITVLASCNGGSTDTSAPITEYPDIPKITINGGTAPPDTSTPSIPTSPTITEPPPTEPPVTDPPVTEPPPTEPPVTEPPVTEPPPTEPPPTEPPVTEPPETEPPSGPVVLPAAPEITLEEVDSSGSYDSVPKQWDDIKKGVMILSKFGTSEMMNVAPEDLTPVRTSPYYKIERKGMLYQSDPIMEQYLSAMAKQFLNDTHCTLIIAQAYRTKAEQQKYYDDYSSAVQAHLARPGYSDFETGYSFHLKYEYRKTDTQTWEQTDLGKTNAHAPQAAQWMERFGAYYGFIRRYPKDAEAALGFGPLASKEELYTYRYVGTGCALVIQYLTEAEFYRDEEGNPRSATLEDFTEYIKNYTAEGKHLKVSCTAPAGMLPHSYEMWYVPANKAGTTNVQIPTGNNLNLTISGNYLDGFIVVVGDPS